MQILMKFSDKEEYLKPYLKGNIRFMPLKHYKEYESDGYSIGDKYEGSLVVNSSETSKGYVAIADNPDFKNPTRINGKAKFNYGDSTLLKPISCMVKLSLGDGLIKEDNEIIIDKSLIKELCYNFGDYVLIIMYPKKYLDLIESNLNKSVLSPTNGDSHIALRIGDVHYHDIESEDNTMMHDVDVCHTDISFCKSDKYKYQHEYRLKILNIDAKNKDDSYQLGDIFEVDYRDAIIIKTEQLNDFKIILVPDNQE